MRSAQTKIIIAIFIASILTPFILPSFGYCNSASETSVAQKTLNFIKAFGKGDTITFFNMASSKFLIQEVMPDEEVISYHVSNRWGDELKKTSARLKDLESFNLRVMQEGSHADVYGKLRWLNKENEIKGYFWARLNSTTNGWVVSIFKVDWSDSIALEKVYAIRGPNYAEEMASVQKWAGVSFGDYRDDVLKKLGNPDKEVKGYQYAHYESKGIVVGYVTTWDLWVKSLSIRKQNYKTIRGIEIGDSEALLKEKYGLGYNITTWGKSKRKTYSYVDFADLKWMEFEIMDGVITGISFSDWAQEQRIQR
ncbi:MAG: hypothetical protein M1379_01590 [Firmicutes bacterium]|nr:hypothetical protein [Bacillota bacterium]